ncbi:MAG: methylenetetrahydrofolate--tRNA-(uracil(54)-C(5))-methyltransferase (FADH(2)-oxidizing) TrmFO [Deltaproteobacteria bacterium]|jgi:methylenetetrahydrofolate--tRNA-(uracil-5-)-methyltransferase|nr:methylenetetrahydrofolate--tRNA-(uracil(54)-C(5))-methyltransferase (FADH(2)-oxidizing) TrmFO [Deltaproteobacteria bacterium]MBT4642874.1 methylenetetrahydrofolate--tRNA-(uracil(54)-C(5))-methyltransferase (FADH(2)-oxidizing) TrmFO [Deltaproteobacteria bacterium]MBT6504413.1 methylenetetrahydrofolate--tRNA-(uracil(54)-C(5))-methyltransferase (FADH(2)-oxidizing) TrmFO [Deltaproteobacteria bacterium]MBT7712229.1 methylenetetrahydrofolate--tRNA-(uracil(54)-C(5))-methyltransferase (FADH(2)-oxidiz
MSNQKEVAVIGAGLAGCEAAWQLGSRGIPVVLYEMRPTVMTPAHQTGQFAELVCSNSLKSREITNAHGLLKAELKLAGSIIVQSAEEQAVPAGSALAVDRLLFASAVEERIKNCPHIRRQNEEVTDITALQQDYSRVILATGPLSSDTISQSLRRILNDEGLFFYDAIAPVVYTESVNMKIAFKASRYGKGDADYINCPMNREEYERLIIGLRQAEKMPFRDFEQAKHFEGCLPVEVMAERGMETLSYGPMKPVGLRDPRTGEQPWAVLQLRQEDRNGELVNLVGCQTRMRWGEQKRLFQEVPGLENCEFARMGSMHRNTYINAPLHLSSNLELKNHKGIYLAGQITGVEGYVESAAMGMWVAMNIQSEIKGDGVPEADAQTMLGALVNYLMTASPDNFQPMNSNFGLLRDSGEKRPRNKKERRRLVAEQALHRWQNLLDRIHWPVA